MSDWPIYYRDKLIIGNLNSNIGIVTLWTPVQTITSKIDENFFAVAGPLYSKRGINFILRNILANPRINTLILCGSNLSGSAEALSNFIEKGINESYEIIDVDKAFIEKEIPLEAIEKFRLNINLIDLTGEFNVEKILPYLKNAQDQPAQKWSEPQIFPEAEKITAEKFQSEKTAYTVRADTIKNAWPQILKYIMKFGSKKGMIKVGEAKEIINLITVIEEENPDKPEIPGWFPFNKNDLKLYYKGFLAQKTQSEEYGYGERMMNYPLGIPKAKYKSKKNTLSFEDFTKFKSENFSTEFTKSNISLNQLEEIYLKLKSYKYDRGAVISIWNPWVDNIAKGWQSDEKVEKSGYVPCMTQLQFAFRDRALQLTAYFRVNDMFDAWPRNAFALRKLQYELAKKLDMKPGFLTTISSIAQIYENNFEAANEILKKNKIATFCRPDHRGNVIIEVEGSEIVAKHTDISGNEILEEFRVDGREPKSAQIMADILATNLIFSEIPHAMDIARELMKAELAIKNNLKFIQDKDLEL